MLSTRTQIVEVNLAMDWRVFAFTAGVGVLTGLLFGVAPAFRGTALTPADALRDHSRGVVSGGGRFQVGHALVALQVALSFVLVFGSTLFVRTLVALTTQDMGFESSRVLVGNLDLRRTGVDARATARRCSRASARRLAAVPGVEAAAASFVTPVSGSTWNLEINVPGYAANERRGVLFNGVSPDYFRAMGTPLLAGRDIADSDRRGAPNVDHRQRGVRARNSSPARTRSARRSRSSASTRRIPMRVMEIVGLVGEREISTLARSGPADHVRRVRRSSASSSRRQRLAIRTAGAPMESRNAIVQAIAGVNKDIAVDLKTLDEDLGANVLQERLVASLSASSAASRCCSRRSASTA